MCCLRTLITPLQQVHPQLVYGFGTVVVNLSGSRFFGSLASAVIGPVGGFPPWLHRRQSGLLIS